MLPDSIGDLLGLLGLAVFLIIAGWVAWTFLRPSQRMDVAEARVIELPLPNGAWQAFNSPATRVPSHGTDWLGQRFAIDLVGIEPGYGHTRESDWRSRFWLEPPERLVGFGSVVVAPADATVVSVYDGVNDRGACRSLVGLASFYASSISLALVTWLRRSPAGLAAMAGNHVVLALDSGPHAALMHLRRGSVLVRPGERVRKGQPLGQVGNTGNTTQPHLHLHLMDRADAWSARGVPMAFAGYELRTGKQWEEIAGGMPENGACIRRTAVEAAQPAEQNSRL